MEPLIAFIINFSIGYFGLHLAFKLYVNYQTKKLQEKAKENHWNAYVPDIALCTDNAGMIGIVAHYKYEKGEFSNQDVSPSARFPLS